MEPKKIPSKLTKKKMVDIYGNDYNDRFVLDEIKAIQIRLNINVRVKILSKRVKDEFFKLHGLPSGYVID